MKTLKQHMNYSNKQRGVTLVELMIAITIGSIIMVGISSVYTSSKRSYKLQEEFSRLQENGRFAINHITRFVRSAGYSGCASGLDTLETIMNDADKIQWNFATGIEGYDYIGSEPGQLITLPATHTPAAEADNNDWVSTTASNLLPNPTGTTYDNLGHTYAPITTTDNLGSRPADSSGSEVSQDNSRGHVSIACPMCTIERSSPYCQASNGK